MNQTEAILDISKLPNLPQTLIELIDKCNAQDRNIKEIGAIVARDASISARILQLANSAFIGARNKFTDIEQAVIYLGIDTIRNLAISVSVHETFSEVDKSGILNMGAFWHHSFLTAVLAKSLGQSTSYPDPAKAYLTGLLHDLGKLLLFISFPDQYPSILQQHSNGDVLTVLERSNLQVTHHEASSLLVSQWNLEQSITDAIFCHHQEQSSIAELDQLTRLLYVANRYSNSLTVERPVSEELVESLLNINPASVPTIIEAVNEEVDLISSEMGIRTAKDSLVKLLPNKQVEADKATLTKKVQAISAIGGVVDNLLKADDFNRVVRVIEESFHILFNIPYCLLILPDADSGVMRIYVSTNNQNHGHDELSVPVTINRDGMLFGCLHHGTIHTTMNENQLGVGELETQCMRLLDASGLVTIPVPLEDSVSGLLVIGVNETDAEAIMDQQETLTLLASQVGMRIRLERLQQKAAADQVTALTRIARQIAHEINNPVATLQNHLMSLRMKLEGQDKLQDDLSVISQEIQLIARITEQLNDLSPSPHETLTEEVDINEIVAHAADFYRQSLLPENKITIMLSLDRDLPRVHTSAVGIRQITGNLIKNSIEALNNMGQLVIKTKKSPASSELDEIYISIEDDGPGTPPELAENIFTAGVTTKGIGHVGLGLAISRKLVHELGGTITYSSGKAVGTKFTVSLPCKPQ